MKKSLVITDVTRMQEARVCMAGYDAALHCIRPVLPRQGIPETALYANGRAIVFPSAEVEFSFDRPTPQPPHTEDVPYAQNSARFVRRLPEERWRNVLVATLSEHVDAIFGQPILSGPGHYVMDGHGTHSLGTVVPRRVTEVIYRQGDNSKWDYRLGFDDGKGTNYKLGVTDLAWRYFLDHQRANGHMPHEISAELTSLLQARGVYLRIGLARGWDKYPGRCYLQITGVHTFPDYLKGLTFADFARYASKLSSPSARLPGASSRR